MAVLVQLGTRKTIEVGAGRKGFRAFPGLSGTRVEGRVRGGVYRDEQVEE